MKAIRHLLAVVVLAAAAPAALAQGYPTKPVRVIVPFAAGGPADIFGRYVAQRLQEALGQSFIIDNRTGAGAIIGTEAAAKSAPDGYTLLVISNTHTANETLVASRPYELMRDFTAVAGINVSENVLVVHPSVPANTVQELVALAKAQPKKLNYASSGTGTPYHMAGEQFRARAGIEIVHVPYKASSAARTDVIAGQVQMMFDAVSTMAPNIRAGKVRGIATTGVTRAAQLLELPTMQEAGIADYESLIWLGLVAPAKTPREIVERLNAEVDKVIARPDTREAWAKQGAAPMIMSAAEFDKFLRDDVVKQARVVKLIGGRLE